MVRAALRIAAGRVLSIVCLAGIALGASGCTPRHPHRGLAADGYGFTDRSTALAPPADLQAHVPDR